MAREPIYTGIPWERTVKHAPGNITDGPLVFTSGLTARAPDGSLVGPGDMRLQALQVLSNSKKVLRAARTDPSNIVKLSIFVTSIPDFLEHRNCLEELFAAAPSSTPLEVRALQEPGMVIEIETVAETPHLILSVGQAPATHDNDAKGTHHDDTSD
jgi:2-iminobutanoate/2-iminopropanoate deaminase